MESKVSSLESKLDSLIGLLSVEVKTGGKFQCARCRDPELVRKDDDNTDNDGNTETARKGGTCNAARLGIAQKFKSQYVQST